MATSGGDGDQVPGEERWPSRRATHGDQVPGNERWPSRRADDAVTKSPTTSGGDERWRRAVATSGGDGDQVPGDERVATSAGHLW